MIKNLILLFFTFNTVFCFSQENRYWVFLKDKKDTKFNPYEYFDSKAIERRIKNSISIYDSTDFPINNTYKSIVENIVNKINSESRWFNCLSVNASDIQINQVKALDFVSSVDLIYSNLTLCENEENDIEAESYDTELLRKQVERLGIHDFEINNIDGKGIRIAIFDAGFPNVDTHLAFEHIRKDNRIIKTFDFTKKKEFVYSYNSHGTSVMSCIAGIYDGKKMGLATGAEFLLARTEVNSEPFSEEENWLAAVEWADKNGANIINSSLGYTYHRYFVKDMNGENSLVARAGNLAAKKGILVVNAMGNDGSNKWKYVGTPADADSVLSIGGINPNSDIHIDFSSYGPTFDKRLKPNVCAYGEAVAASKSSVRTVTGTSFASPLIAGFAACVWQLNPSMKNMELFHEIELSAHLYPYYDYAHGYGIPQANYFTNTESNINESTFDVIETNDSIKIKILNFSEKSNSDNQYLFYHLRNKKNIIDYYAVIKVSSEFPLSISKNELSDRVLMIYYKSFTKEINK